MKKLLFILVFLSLLSGVFASVTDEDLRNNAVSYFTLDNDSISGTTVIDSVGNFNGTNNGATCGVTGQINQACSFDGSNDYISIGGVSQNPTAITLSAWFKPTASDNSFVVSLSDGSTDAISLQVRHDGSDFVRFQVREGSNNNLITHNTGISLSQFYHVVGTWDGSTMRLYLDGTQVGSTAQNNAPLGLNEQKIGVQNGINYANGVIDEVGIFNESKNASEVFELYSRQLNNINGDQYDFTSASTPQIQTNLTDGAFYNTTTLTGSATTTSNVNMSYFLDGGSEVSICNDCNSSSFTLSSLSETTHNLSLKSVNSDGTNWNNISFTIDTTNPTINNSLPSEINTYTLGNLSSYVTCDDDVGVESCTIDFQPDNTTQNVTENKTFTFNGNQTYTIRNTDNAGNTLEVTGTIFVNPEFFRYFEDNLTSSTVTNFEIDGVSYTNFFKSTIYTYGLGNSTIEFTKAGYNSENFTLSFNSTSSNLNETFIVSPVTLTAKAYDIKTLSQLTFNVTIDNGTDVSSFTGLTELFKTYSEIPTGDITLRFSNTDYEDAIFYTTITPTTSVVFDVYLTSINDSSVITFDVKEFDTGNPLENVVIEARKILNGSKVTVQQTVTTSTGTAYLYLDGLEDFEFIFSKDGYTQAKVESIPTVTSYTVRLKESSTQYKYLNDVNYRFLPSASILLYNQSYDFEAFLSGTSITTSSLIVKDNLDNTIFSDTSTNPTGTTFSFSETVNNSNVDTLTFNLTYVKDGQSFTNLRQYEFRGNYSGLFQVVTNFGDEESEEFALFRFFIVLTTIAGFILIGNKFDQSRDYVSLIAILPLMFFGYFGWIPWTFTIVLSIAALVLYLGGNKR